MKLLPRWILTSGLPAFRDGESATALEQTYKVYQAMQDIITEYNSFVETTNKSLEDFYSEYNGDIEVFTTEMRQEFQDFIGVIDLKITDLEQLIENAGYVDVSELTAQLEQMKNDLVDAENTMKEIQASLDLSSINNSISDHETRIKSLEDNAGKVDLSGVEGDIDALETDVSTLRAGVSTLQTRVTTLESKEYVTADEVTDLIDTKIVTALNKDY